jgi:hypothetical protein
MFIYIGIYYIHNMNTKKFFPSWMKQKEVISEEERLENLRNQYAEIIIDLFPRNNQKYYEEMIDEINEDMGYINDFINQDNIRLRDAYLNDQIARTQNYLDNITDYDKIIDDKKIILEINKQKIQDIMHEIDSLSKQLEVIKKNKPYTARGKTTIITKEEKEISDKLEKLPNEKNKLEEVNEELEKYLVESVEIKECQDNIIIEKKKYLEYLNKNWDRFYHDGSMIILPSIN